MTSFRARIQYGALGLIVVLLLLLDLVLYAGFKGVLHAYVDSRLEGIAQAWAEMIADNAEMFLASLEHQGRSQKVTRQTIEERTLSIRLLAPDGRVLWETPAILPPALTEAAVPPSVINGRHVFETISHDAGPPVRRVWTPIHYQGDVRYVLQAETAMRLMHNALTWLQVLLAVGSMVIFGLAWIGSQWLARQALMPIEALSDTARNVSETSSLEPRLALDAPYVEFRRLAQVFNTMMDRLQRAFEGQRRFVTDAAHELHTPLTALKGNLEVAFAHSRTAEEYRETLIGNLAAVDRLIHLCRSLIRLAKLTGEQSQPPKQNLAIEPLLREVIGELKVLGDDRHVMIRVDACPVPAMYGNQEQLQRVFVNLLDNALRHTGPGGTVTATLRATQSHIVLVMEDTGEGIAAEHVPHIFERFYRADLARSRESGGVGLGLAIVKEIVTSHGGDIFVESAIGKGTTFTIAFPISAVPHTVQ
jgi:heavy metal sensor kinase